MIPYPPGPKDVPENLTEVNAEYKLRVILVLTCLIIFLGMYFGLVVGSGLMVPLSLVLIPPPLSILVCVLSVLMFLFLLKGLFKRRPVEKTLRVEIKREDQPELFAFIEKLCAETNAPFPHKVVLTPEVNAMVYYNESILSLFLPTPKNLLVGLGLVNALNLSEFKAVLAHEFGHFSQDSMKLSTYVYVANRVIGDMVYGRDWLDDTLDSLTRTDIRIAVFAWAFKGIIWVFRQILAGAFKGINLLDRSLSRQMEFNADLVSVSVAGSDAIVHALSRANFASDSLMQAINDLDTAAHHQIYTRDLFLHQTNAASFLRKQRKDEKLGIPPPVPEDSNVTVVVFDSNDDGGIPPMWAFHPKNYDREANAKRIYLPCPIDERSPWMLFRDMEKVREKVTWRLNKLRYNIIRGTAVAEPATVQAFIDEEHAETTYDPRYHGLYDDRFLDPGIIEDLTHQANLQPWQPDTIGNVYANLYAGDFSERMEQHRQRMGEYRLLEGLKQGDLTLKKKDFDFRGKRYVAADVEGLFKTVDAELEQDLKWMGDIDRRAYLTYYQMARELGGNLTVDLKARYEFHVAVQQMLRDLKGQQSRIDSAMKYLSDKRQVESGAFQEVLAIFRQAHETLTQALEGADKLHIPPMKNMNAGAPLGPFLLDKPLVKNCARSTQTIEGQWIAKFMEQLSEVLEKVRRIHFKSLGGVLSMQEELAKRWLAELSAAPEVVPVLESVAAPAAPPAVAPAPAAFTPTPPRTETK
jgi:Zn-dependent protease with chaperone function